MASLRLHGSVIFNHTGRAHWIRRQIGAVNEDITDEQVIEAYDLSEELIVATLKQAAPKPPVSLNWYEWQQDRVAWNLTGMDMNVLLSNHKDQRTKILTMWCSKLLVQKTDPTVKFPFPNEPAIQPDNPNGYSLDWYDDWYEESQHLRDREYARKNKPIGGRSYFPAADLRSLQWSAIFHHTKTCNAANGICGPFELMVPKKFDFLRYIINPLRAGVKDLPAGIVIRGYEKEHTILVRLDTSSAVKDPLDTFHLADLARYWSVLIDWRRGMLNGDLLPIDHAVQHEKVFMFSQSQKRARIAAEL
jgi:hypothetical protein